MEFNELKKRLTDHAIYPDALIQDASNWEELKNAALVQCDHAAKKMEVLSEVATSCQDEYEFEKKCERRMKVRYLGFAMLIIVTAVFFWAPDGWHSNSSFLYLHAILTGISVFMAFSTKHPREWFA